MSRVPDEYRQTVARPPRPLPKGLDALAHAATGLWHRRPGLARSLAADAARVLAQAEAVRPLADAALAERLAAAREAVRRRPDADDRERRIAALALICEAADRSLGRRPYRVQVMGALAIARGTIAEMATGEGKTLTAALAAVLAGWTGRPCHVITTNDYLVERDAALLEPLYRTCGVGVGCVTATMGPADRRAGYGAAVTYVTAKDALADHLRDRLVLGEAEAPDRRMVASLLDPAGKGFDALVTRGLDAAIVDEADSVLVDEAVTPLIISAPAENIPLAEAMEIGRGIAASMTEGEDYRVDARHRRVDLTDRGRERLEALADTLPPIWRAPNRRIDLLTQALSAKALFHRDRHYVVEDGRIVIVDEFSGRTMPGRTWSYGLHQAVEAKEGLAVSDALEIRARMSFQDFFRTYRRLGGMTGTGWGVRAELWRNFDRPVVRIPRNRPDRRITRTERVLPTVAAKWAAVADLVAAGHAAGRPVLIGTRDIEASEALRAVLEARGLAPRVLNALRHAEEAAIVADAGRAGALTIATNMAGRGTDILLGPGVAALGGLLVVATERHEARRIDLQLHGRCARQGDPGEVVPVASLEDALVRRFLARAATRALAALLPWPGGAWLGRRVLDGLQRTAERAATRQRRQLVARGRTLRETLTFAGRG